MFAGKRITAKVSLEIIFIKCFRKAVQLFPHYINVCNIFKTNLPIIMKPIVVSYCNDCSQMSKGSLSIKEKGNEPCVKPLSGRKLVSYL